MRQVDIIGVGITNFGKHIDRSLVDLGGKVAVEAIKDAGIKPSQINAGFFANMQAGHLLTDFTIGENVLWVAGINGVPIYNIENACTSGSSAFNLAWTGVAFGAPPEFAVIFTLPDCHVAPPMSILASQPSQSPVLSNPHDAPDAILPTLSTHDTFAA